MLFCSIGVSQTNIHEIMDNVFKSSSFEFSNTILDFPYKENIFYSEVVFPEGKIEIWGEDGYELIEALKRLRRWNKHKSIIMFNGSYPTDVVEL